MGHRIGAFPFGDFDLPLRDQRTGNSGAEQVAPLVHGARAQHREDVIPDEGLPEILDVHLARAHLSRLRLDGLQVLSLAQVRAEGHHLAAIGLLQPFEDDRRVEAARVGQHNLLDHLSAASHGHRSRSSRIRIAFCTWSRFSAWSSTTDCGPSSTSSVISWPRWAGRQCITIASGCAAATSFELSWYEVRTCTRRACSFSWPMLVHTSV